MAKKNSIPDGLSAHQKEVLSLFRKGYKIHQGDLGWRTVTGRKPNKKLPRPSKAAFAKLQHLKLIRVTKTDPDHWAAA